MNVGPHINLIRELLPHKGCKWKINSVKCLGLMLEKTQNSLFKNNYIPQFQKVINTLNRWSNRYIGLRGKITIIKSLALSKLIYLISILPNPPDDFTNKVNDIIFKFVWDKKPDKVKRYIHI